jgi:tetratricopeptide (TPR) repeat protein
MHMLTRHALPAALLCLPCLLPGSARAQEKQQKPPVTVTVVGASPTPADALAPKYAKEGIVYEKVSTVTAYQADGTGEKTMQVTARVLSDSGVHQAGLLNFVYASGNEQVHLDYVRVRKPDGTVIDTPAGDAQDMPTEVTREAPLYSDLRELQIPVKSLSTGDEVEYKIHYVEQKPNAPNEFWGAANFITTNVVLDESYELSFPKDKYVLVLSPANQPLITEENGRRVYLWHSSQLEPTADRKQTPPDPDDLPAISFTTFHSWQEVGDWYAGLARDRAAVTPEIQAKADALVQGKTTDDEKIEAIYHYVSTQVRYIGVDFGIGRYQPHSAETVLENQYGDCKDKHTLLAALLKAAGYHAWPALIGTSVKLHPELPMPAQFDHVITVVSLPHRLIWLDSTPEVTPYRMLMSPIRDKEALVIPTTGQPELMRTPANGPFPFQDTYTATGKIDSDGTLTGHISIEMRGDTEVSFREIFHNLPRAQWQQAGQTLSERMGFAGTVSNLDIGLPERTEKPFVYSYDYTRKQYADWANRRILPLTMAVSLNDLGDDKPTKPIELGSPRIEDHHSVLELPPNYTAILPSAVKYTTDFATYEADYTLDGNKLTTIRKLAILKNEVPETRADDYTKFTKHVEDDENQYIQLVAANAAIKPDTTPSNPEALEFMQTAAANLTNHNYIDARANLQQAQQLNPKQPGLWGEFAYLEMMSNHLDVAIDDLRKEVQYHPESTLAWQQMSQIQIRLKRLDDAAQTLRNELKALPGNTDAEAQLASLLILQKKYDDAATLYETAAKQLPENKEMRIQAGRAEMLSGKHDAGLTNVQQALQGSTDPGVLNDGAYELADFNVDLPTAESSAKKALDTLNKETAQITLGNLSRDDLAHVNLLTATWDTMGWVYFREGNLPLAESYIRAAWNTTQASEVGGHLGQIYEKEGKLKDAAEVDSLALSAGTLTPDPSGTDAIRDRLDKLNARGYFASSKDAGEELGKLRSLSVPKVSKEEGSADFFVLLSAGKVEDVQFIHGDEQLRPAADAIKKVSFAEEFPKDSAARLVRRGILFCSSVTKDCQLTLLLPQSVTLQ